MHANAMRTIPAPANLALGDYTIGWIQFFVWQAAAITMEDFVQWCWRRLVGEAEEKSGRSTSSMLLRTAIGYAWVTVNIWYSLPWIGDVMLRMRLGEQPMLPFSLAEPFVQQLPIPP